MIWCDATADWAVRLDSTDPISIGSRPTINTPSIEREEARACTCTRAWSRSRDCRLLSHERPAWRGEDEEGNARRANPLRSRPTRNVQRFSLLNTDTQSRGATYAANHRPRWKSWKIVICTPVTRQFRSMIHRGEWKEESEKERYGANFEALLGYEKIHIMPVMNGICIVQNVSLVIDSAHY